MPFWAKKKEKRQAEAGAVVSLPVIKTARDLEAINTAVSEGFIPIIRKVERSAEINSKYALVRNTRTGAFEMIGDYRAELDDMTDREKVIDWTSYYPYHFEYPFAAYLVPSDLSAGTRVLLEDLIEDLIGATWNQGDVYRLSSCEAIWDGQDIVIQYDAQQDRTDFIG